MSNNSTEVKNNVIVGDHDVLSGRGVNIADHPGNQRFRILIASRANQLVHAPKKDVADGIIQHIQGLGGRFLKRLPCKGPWEELKKKEVLKKTCQALHDCIRLEGYANGVEVPKDVAALAHKKKQQDLKTKKVLVPLRKHHPHNASSSKSMNNQERDSEEHEGRDEIEDDVEVSIRNKKNKIIIHKSSRYKNHDPNMQYFYYCRRLSTYGSRNCDRSALAKQVIEAMATKGLSFWIDDDETGLREMTESERWKAVKKKIANDKFHCTMQQSKKRQLKKATTSKQMTKSVPLYPSQYHRVVAYRDAVCPTLTDEREEMALQAMISLGQSRV